MARSAIRGRTRPNPDRQALVADVLAELDPQGAAPWQERWEHARELAITDVQAELLEGLRDFGQQFVDLVFTQAPVLELSELQAIQAWMSTAPAAFRAGGPLERGERAAANAEAEHNYAELVVRLFPDQPRVQRRLGGPAMAPVIAKFWGGVLRWTAHTLDRGVAEAARVLWAFEPFQDTLPADLVDQGPDVLADELRQQVIEIFPRTTAGDPITALRVVTE